MPKQEINMSESIELVRTRRILSLEDAAAFHGHKGSFLY